MSIGSISSPYRRASQATAQRWTTVFDAVPMFKIVVQKFQYNLSDEMTEFFIRDRKTFQDFLGITPYHTIPDTKTIFGKLINTVPNR
jgi:hypothetical protein